MNATEKPLPSPDEIQRKLADFMRQEFGDRVVLAAEPKAETAETGAPTADAEAQRRRRFEFPFRPKEIKAHLDRFVVQQDDAKKVLSIAVCDHYNHVKAAAAGDDLRDYMKQNVLLIGPTGVGKTYLIKTIADFIGVPFVKADATKFSETGYVGGDVEDLVRELVHRADGDVQLAQYGIIYLDEIDKIAAPANVVGRDVSGRGVQTNLLKLMEETEVPLRSPTDLQAQLQAAFEFQRQGKLKRETINTRHILFIVSGAFDGLLDIVRRRVRQADIGFGTAGRAEPAATSLHQLAQTTDFVKFGFEPEFIARLPVRVVLGPLTVADLYRILRDSEGSVRKQYEASFRSFGIDVRFRDDGLQAIAERAAAEHTGARGLLTVCERVLREFKYELPSASVRQLIINRALVESPAAELERVLTQPHYQERELAGEFVHEFEQRFQAAHKLTLRLAPPAIAAIVERAARDNRAVAELCAELFRDYPFGLRLVANNTGQTEFEIPIAALAVPDKYLSELVVASYRQAGTAPPQQPCHPELAEGSK